MERVLPIPSNSKKLFFRRYVELIGPVLGLGQRKRTLDVLALLLYFNDKYKAIEDLEIRCKIIFNYDTRIEILNELGINTSILNNCFTELRKHKLISNKNVINKNIIIYAVPEFKLTFNMTLNEEEETTEGVTQ
jgi:hypothetical protein